VESMKECLILRSVSCQCGDLAAACIALHVPVAPLAVYCKDGPYLLPILYTIYSPGSFGGAVQRGALDFLPCDWKCRSW